MTSRRLPPRAKTTPELNTLNTLLTAQEAAAATVRPPRGPSLFTWSQIEPWQRDNHYIQTGYRPASYSYTGSFQSLFYLHNESVNIHSHVLGAFLFFFIGVSVYLFESHGATLPDVLAFSCFFVGAVTCLATSATYHLISNHSPEVNRFGNQLDYVGIVALITGSFVPSVYYGFYCELSLQQRYWAMVSSSNIARFPRAFLILGHDLDWCDWPGMHRRFHQSKIPYARLAAFQSSDVRCYGLECCLSCCTCNLAVWSTTAETINGTFLACAAGDIVCFGCCHLCCTSNKSSNDDDLSGIYEIDQDLDSYSGAAKAW